MIPVFEDGDGAEKDESGVAVVVELGRIMGEDALVKVEEDIVDGDESRMVCVLVRDGSRLLSAILGSSSASLLRLWRGTACSSR